MAIAPTLNIPMTHTFADGNMVLVTIPAGGVWLQLAPVTTDVYTHYSGADGAAASATVRETWKADKPDARYIGWYGTVLISGTSGNDVEVIVKADPDGA